MPESMSWLLLTALRARDRGRSWAARLLLIAVSILVALYLLSKRQAVTAEQVDAFELEAARFKRRPGQKLVHLAGRERAGKSAVGNALLGTDFFGPEADPGLSAELQVNWWLRELPAAAVRLSSPEYLDAHLQSGDIVVLVVDEQLFANDRKWLEMLRDHYPDIHAIVAINKADLLAGQYTAEEAAELQAAVREEAVKLVASPQDVVWTAAAGEKVDVEALRVRLGEAMAQE